jgi:integrase
VNLNNWRRRVWAPAIEAAGIRKPARIYDLRATFASDALAAGVPILTLARVMGTSVRMIERSYGALLDGAGADFASRLNSLDAQRDPFKGQRGASLIPVHDAAQTGALQTKPG